MSQVNWPSSAWVIPEPEYAATRHNAGFWLVRSPLPAVRMARLRPEKKFLGHYAKGRNQ